jgi:hypothetical protein
MGERINKLRKLSPIRIIEEERKRVEAEAARSKVKLDLKDAYVIALAALTAAFITCITKIMILMRWSTFPDNTYFSTWHPITPWIAIIGCLLYIYALYAKGIRYWLAYFPAVCGIGYLTVQIMMINAWMHPHALKTLFSWIGPLPEWLTGGAVK